MLLDMSVYLVYKLELSSSQMIFLDKNAPQDKHMHLKNIIENLRKNELKFRSLGSPRGPVK